MTDARSSASTRSATRTFWGDTLKLHQAIAGSANGGVGAGVSPTTALAVGLKVDADAVPADVAAGIKAGTVDLDDPSDDARAAQGRTRSSA